MCFRLDLMLYQKPHKTPNRQISDSFTPSHQIKLPSSHCVTPRWFSCLNNQRLHHVQFRHPLSKENDEESRIKITTMLFFFHIKLHAVTPNKFPPNVQISCPFKTKELQDPQLTCAFVFTSAYTEIPLNTGSMCSVNTLHMTISSATHSLTLAPSALPQAVAVLLIPM